MSTWKRSPWKVLVALVLALALVGAACGDDAEDDTGAADGGDTGTETTDGEAAGTGEDPESVNIGWIPWDEDVAVTFLWEHILEERGYSVELTQLDVAPVYSGMAQGDLDVFLDAWLPTTHEDYWAEFGDQLEDVGVWYDQGTLNIAVPEYLEDVNTIADLQGNADMFGGEIIGIEPGAGLMRITREEAMPTYGLEENYTLVEGSTPAMLAELERATNNEEPVVVTLWHPHWAYSAFPIKDLEDPEGAMGEAEQLHVVGRTGFQEDYSQLSSWLANFEMPDDQLASLEEMVIQGVEKGDFEDEAAAVDAWLEEPANQELVNGWLS